MTVFVPRSAWGARAAKPGGNRFTTILGTAVHWEASAPPASHSQCDDAVRQIQAFHMGPQRGWNDIAYNLVACNHNYLYDGRQGGTAANGTNYGNDHFPAVCWLGGPGHTPEDGALSAIATAHSRLGGLGKPIYPHNHFLPTACPGPFLTNWVHAGAHPPYKPPPVVLKHFSVDFTDKGGKAVHQGPWNRDELDSFAGRVIENNPAPGPKTTYEVTFDPAGSK